MRALQDDFREGGGGAFFAGIDVHDFEAEGIANVEIDVVKLDLLPAAGIRQLDEVKRLPVMGEA